MDLTLPSKLEAKYVRLKQIIAGYGRVAVACSGGVDSTLLLRAAKDALGSENVLAVLGSSPLQPEKETTHAEQMIEEVGCVLEKITWDPFVYPEIAANPKDRCYLCKKTIYTFFFDTLKTKSIYTLLDGSNVDDLGDYRPGRQAVSELGVKTPLIEAELSKDEIRQISHYQGLSNWNKPSASCLATRVPTGRKLSKEIITLIDHCESYLNSLGYAGFRVRMVENGALLELASGDLAKFVSGPDRASLVDYFSKAGIERISVDLYERGE